MKIKSVRIRNFRTVREDALIEIDDYLTIVGPNNAGKTNLMKAIQMFFTGYDNSFNYLKERDFSKSAERKAKTTITVIFEKEENKDFDKELFKECEEIYEYLESGSSNSNEITVYLTFHESQPSYQLHYNIRKKKDKQAQYSLKQKNIISKILDHFSIHYIPSEKSVKEVFNTLITPLISKQLGKKFEEHREIIDSVFNDTSLSISNSLKECEFHDYKFLIRAPENQFDKMIKGFEYNLNDSLETNVFDKGMGIQTASLLACFIWVTEREIEDGKNVIWLLEEPESFLNPSLSESHKKLLYKLRQMGSVVNTTHSLQFVPSDPEKILGVRSESNITKIEKFKKYADATENLRKSLGVQFSHFFNLGIFNVLLEGQTDRIYLQKVIENLPEQFKGENINYRILNSSEISFLDFGGTTQLEGFIRTTHEFIVKERPCIAVFDGDHAGMKSVGNLQSYFGKRKINYRANKEFVSLRKDFAIEWYFPNEWLIETYEAHNSWFENFILDPEGNISGLKVRDRNKTQFQNLMISKIDSASDHHWLDKWVPLLNIIELSLQEQRERIGFWDFSNVRLPQRKLKIAYHKVE